ncbi:MAG: hypothetical protein ACR2PA_21420 [Hyphomicrobiaceae bacterium]
MIGSTRLVYAAPRIAAIAALLCAIVVSAMIARPQALMQSALTSVPGAQGAFPDTIVDPDMGGNYRVLTGYQGDQDVSGTSLGHQQWFAHVEVGDRITISDPGQRLRVMEITDVRPLGAALSKSSGAGDDEHLALVIGKLIDQSDPQTVRLLINVRPSNDPQDITDLRPRSL